MPRARKISPVTLPGAVAGEMPEKMAPELATLVDKPPPRPEEWLFEIKFDGYRMLARIDGAGGVRMISRNGLDWSSKMPHLAARGGGHEAAAGLARRRGGGAER